MTQGELDWFYGGGAGAFWPDLWERFRAPIPEAERGDLIAAYHRRLFSGDLREEVRHARAWAGWENALASIDSEGPGGLHATTGTPLGSFDAPADYARAFSRLENHYFVNNGFLAPDQAILANMGRIAHIPGTIVQGRYDMICPPTSAWALARAWPVARLEMIAKAGHALSEPGITAALVRAMDALGERLAPRARAALT
jgi:proline iminopeptidase